MAIVRNRIPRRNVPHGRLCPPRTDPTRGWRSDAAYGPAAALTTGLSGTATMAQWQRIFNVLMLRIVPAF